MTSTLVKIVPLVHRQGNSIRRIALAGTDMARAQAGTIRLKLLKIGVVILRNSRRLRVHLSGACPDKALLMLAAIRLDPG